MKIKKLLIPAFLVFISNFALATAEAQNCTIIQGGSNYCPQGRVGCGPVPPYFVCCTLKKFCP